MTSPWGEVQTVLLSPASNRKKGAALILGLSVLALFAKVLFSSHILVSTSEGDLANQFLGWRAFGFSELKKGHLALWNPFIFCGAPYFAGFQSALLYPPNWTFLLLPLIFALNASFVLHVFLAGFFTYLWLASRRMAFLPALLGAFVFMFGGAFYAHLYPGHLPNLCAMAWIPLVFLSVEKILAGPSLKNILLGAGVLSLQLLAGHPQYFLYTLLFAGLYSSVLLFQAPENRGKKSLGLVGSGLIAAALTAVQWLPGLEASGEFGRNFAQDPEAQRWFSMDPQALYWLLSQAFSRRFFEQFGVPESLWWESCLILGFVPLFFILKNLFGKKDWEMGFAFSLAVLAILLALGPHTPLYPLLEKVPPFGSFRGSFKFVIFFQVFAAFLAARGLQGSLTRSYAALLALFGLFHLWMIAWSLTPSFDVERWMQNGAMVQENIKNQLGDGRIYWDARNDRGMAWGLPSIWGDDPFPSKRFQALMVRQDPDLSPNETTLNFSKNRMALTRLAFLISGAEDSTKVEVSPVPRMGRFHLIGNFEQVPGIPEALAKISNPKFDPAKQVLLEEAPDPAPVENSGKGKIAVNIHDTDWFEFKVQLDKPQVFLMTDTYATGWKVLPYPDSIQRTYRVMPGDVFARAIPLAAGNHHFDLVYDPPGFSLGRIVSLVALPLYLLAWGVVFSRREMAS